MGGAEKPLFLVSDSIPVAFLGRKSVNSCVPPSCLSESLNYVRILPGPVCVLKESHCVAPPVLQLGTLPLQLP